MHKPAIKGFSRRLKDHNLIIVNFMIKRCCWKSIVFFRIRAGNDQPGRIRKQQYFEVGYRFHQHIFLNIPIRSAYQKEGRNRVKVKDLKPKQIKDYLEYKFSQKSPALLKFYSLFYSLQSLHSNSREECVKRNIYMFDIERVKLKQQSEYGSCPKPKA
ncbi:hypothetical protein GQ457_10G006800 [Hibiscus cannabinus]